MPRRQTAKHTVQLQVLRHGEPFLSQVLRGSKPLSIGPQGAPTIPTEQLQRNLDLLVPGPAGYGLRLAPPLNGEVTLPDRRLRIRDGLLLDPRPEPLVLGDGAGGTIDLGDGLSLVFAVHCGRHRFRRWSRPDPGLCAALGLTCVVFAGTVLAMAPWSWQPRRPRVEKLLVQRPGAVIRLTRRRPPRPTPPPGPTDKLKRRAKSEPRPTRRAHRPRRKKPDEPSGRGVLRLLGRINKRHPGLLGQGDDATRRLLQRLDRSLASVRGPGRRSEGGAGSLDQLASLLGNEEGSDDDLAGSVAATRLALPGRRVRLRTPSPAASAPPRREAIRKVVMAHGAEVRLCYEQAMLRSAQSMEGRLLLRWTIDASGRASNPTVVRDTVGASDLASCVLKRIRGWVFPPCASGGCRVVYPFDFYPSRTNQS